MKNTKSIFLFILSLIPFDFVSGQQLKAVQQIEGIPPKVEYRAITHDGSGNIYVATSVDVFLIPYNSNRAQPMTVGDQIMDVEWTEEDGLILLYKDGTIRFTSTGKILTVDPGPGATCMDVTKYTIWVGTKNGVYTVSIPQEKIINHFTTEDEVLKSNEINFIHTDPYGIRWIGTKAGVVRIQGKQKWKLYEEEQAITAITSTSEGAWMSAEDNMWLVNSYNRWFEIDAWRNLVVGNVKALSADAKGILYIASEILVKYDPYEEKVLSMNEGGSMDQLIILSQGPGKNVWMAGHNGMARVMEDTSHMVTVAEGKGITVSVEVKSAPVCAGMATGHLAVSILGGTPPYTYNWNTGNSTTAEATNLVPGLYQVTITDQEGKSVLASGIVPASPPLRVTLALTAKCSDKLAADGKASATIKGGAEPFQYQWSNGETKIQAVALTEGAHSFQVTDANGCVASAYVTTEAEKVLKSLDIATVTLGQTIRVDKLYFTADSSTIQPASYGVLEEIYAFLKDNDNVVIEVGGHTNSLPEDEYCDRLSTARAKNIAEYLYSKGIPESRIAYKGYGKRQPIASNQTVDGRRRNQRVEIKIVSL